MDNYWIETAWTEYVRELGFTLQRARLRHGWTQASVAGRAGISTYSYQKIEHGKSNCGYPANPRLRTLVAISSALEMPLSSLVDAPLA